MNTFEQMIINYLEELTETLCYVVDCYKCGKTDLRSARTYYNCVLDAYRGFRDAYTMPEDVKKLFEEFGAALNYGELDIDRQMNCLEA